MGTYGIDIGSILEQYLDKKGIIDVASRAIERASDLVATWDGGIWVGAGSEENTGADCVISVCSIGHRAGMLAVHNVGIRIEVQKRGDSLIVAARCCPEKGCASHCILIVDRPGMLLKLLHEVSARDAKDNLVQEGQVLFLQPVFATANTGEGIDGLSSKTALEK